MNNLLFISLTILSSCNNQEKERVFRTEIFQTKILGKNDVGRGNFEIVFYNGVGLDTIPVNSHNSLLDKIDSFTLVSKVKNTYILHLINLKSQ